MHTARRSPAQPRLPRPLPLAGAVITALVSLQAASQGLPATALPSHGQVVHGTASISQTGNALTVRQSSGKLITNWDTFDIGSGARVDFLQPSSSAMALNRVLSADPSKIYGQLNANGQVFLVSPAGVLFAPGAKVNVGGLVASTLDISNADFAAGNFRFSGGALATGEVANEGAITTADKGYAALLGPRVRNAGTVTARMGTVALAAGDAVTLDFHGDSLIGLQIDGAAARALAANSGAIGADGGLVVLAASSSGDPLATVLNNTGTVHATTLANVNGVIRLEGGASGVVSLSGTLDASGKGAGETGGTVKVLGNNVGLFDGARIDVSGSAGGGTALVGGNWQGSGSEQRASATYMDANARIAADAIASGNGGTVVVWADGATRFNGAISARGGLQGGDGGKVETSGKDYLDATGSVSAGAAQGAAGLWLLDPRNVSLTTSTSGGSLTASNPAVFAATADTAKISVTEINTALNAGTSVLINTGASGTQSGDITVNSSVLKSAGGDATLTLQAARDVNVNANITATTGKLGVVLNAGSGGGVGSVSMASAASIVTNGGSLTIGGGADPSTTPATGGGVTNIGFRMVGGGALISTGSGNILINARGASTSQGFSMATSANTIQTTSGNITINASSATASSMGMNSGTNTIQSTGSGNITIDTQASGTASGFGLTMGSSGTSTISVADGTLGITARSASGDSALTMGSGANALQATGTGAVVINATSSSSGTGINMATGTNLVSTVSGNLSMSGTSSTGNGISLGTGAGTNTIHTTNGNIELTGNSGSGTALRMAPDTTQGVIEASGAGNITLTADSLSVAPTGTGSMQLKSNGGALVIQSRTDATSIGVGTGAGTLAVNAQALATLQDGFSSITIGRATGTGAVTVGNATFADNLVLRQASGGTAFTGALALGANNLSVASGGGGIGQSAGSITAVGNTTLAAGAGNDITLAQSGNNFATVAIASGRNVSLADSNAINLGASTVNGNLALTAGGAVTQTGVLAVTGGLTIATTHTAGDVVVNNAGASATVLGDTRIGNNYTLTTGGPISQAAGTTLVVGNNFTVSGGSLAAPAAGNVIGGSDNSAGSGTLIKQVGVIDLSTKDIGLGAGNIAVGGNLNVLSVASASTIAAPVGAGTTAVNLNLAGNTIGGPIAISASAPTVTPSGAPVATGIVQNGASLAVGGSASFSAAASAANVGGAAGDITLSGAGNVFAGPVSVSGNNVLVNSANALTLGTASATGTLALRAAGGNITGTGAIAAAGNASFTADGAGASIVIDNAGNNFGAAVSFAGAGGLASVSVADSTALDLQALALSGNLTARAASLTDSGALSIGGTTSLQATGSVVLDDAGHAFTGAVSVNAASASLRAGGALNLGASDLTGDLALNAQGAITQSGALAVGGNLSLTTTHAAGDVALNNSGAATTKLGTSSVGGNYAVTATGRNVAQNAGSNIHVAGDFSVAAASVSTNPADNLVGGTDGTLGGGTFIRQVGVVTLNDLATAGNLTVLSVPTGQVFAGPAVHGAAVTLGNAANNIAGTITITTSGPAVVSSGAPVATGIQQAAGTSLQVGGTSNFATSGGDIAVANAGNTFGGAVSATGNNISLRGNGALQLGAIGATGKLLVNATAGITQTASAITAAGTSSLDAGAGAIVLNTAGNDFTGAVTLANTSGGIAITDANALGLGPVNAAGALAVTAGGMTTLNGNVSGTGVSFAGGGAGAVTLGSDVAIDARSGNLAMGAMTGGTRNLTLTSDSIALTGNWSGTGAYTLQTSTDGTAVNLAGATTGYALSAAELASIAAANASLVTIGRTTAGTVNVGALGFDDKLALRGGAVNFSGTQTYGNGLDVVGTGRVQLSAATVTATGGSISLTGVGSAPSTQGVSVTGGSSLRTTSGSGDITIVATNPAATGSAYGMGAGTNLVEATGSGNITISAQSSGTGTGFGVTIGGGGTNTVRTADGNIRIDGQSSGSDTAFSLGTGTNVIESTGSGKVTLSATATGSGNGLSSGGTGNAIRTASGALSLTGAAVSGNAISIASGSNGIGSGSGAVTVSGTSTGSGAAVSMGSGTNTIGSGSGDVTIVANASGGTGRGLTLSNGTNTIGAGGTGRLNITASSATTSALSLGSASSTEGTSVLRVVDGAMRIDATSGASTSALVFGVGSSATLPATNTIEATLAGSVTIDARNTGSGTAISMGTNSNNTIRTAAGDLSVSGTSAQKTGIAMASGTNSIVSAGGNVSVRGTSLANDDGVSMGTGTNLVAAGGKGNLTVTGVSQGTSAGFGVSMGTSGNNTLRVDGGTLAVRAQSAGEDSGFSMASGTNNLTATGAGRVDIVASNTNDGNGVSMALGSNTVRAGTGRIDVSGTGAGTGHGVTMGSGTNTILSTGGAVNLTGTATGTGNGFYVTVTGKDSILTATGAIGITGASAGGTAIALRPSAQPFTVEASGAGDVTFRADGYDATPGGTGSVRIASNGGVLGIVQLTPGTSIGIGDGASGTLNWSGAEVQQLSGFSSVRIGNRESGALDLRPPWFPFPMVLPPATLTPAQQKFNMVKATAENLVSSLGSIGELPPTLAVTRRFSLLVQGFDASK